MNTTLMRRALWFAGLLLALFAVNYAIAGHEKTLREGRVIRLELAPRDPRSLMQGDYMALRFAIADPIQSAAYERKIQDGNAVLTIDTNNVGRFARLDDWKALESNEAYIAFRLRGRDVRIVTNAYFFEEGTAQRFEAARFGEFRVRANGEALLTHLLDEKFTAIASGK